MTDSTTTSGQPIASSGTFTLLLFASASSYTSIDSLTLPAPMPLSQLFPTLEKKFPGMTDKILKSCAVSVNLEYVDMPEENSKVGVEAGQGDVTLVAGDEVGIIPPVSGG